MIEFGTAGWRGIIGEEFTFRNVRLVTQAIASYVRANVGEGRSLVVGYDTRFLSEKFASEAAKVLSQNQIVALRCVRDVPSPALAHEIIARGAAGGINFTVSHNPPEYSGMKISDASGAPALPTFTAAVEDQVSTISDDYVDEYFLDPQFFVEVDPTDGYLQRLTALVDLERIAAKGVKLAIDTLYGTCREYVDRLLVDAGVDCEVLHNFRDPYFGGYSPDPSEESLAELGTLVAGSDRQFGLATDIDGDRFAIVDSDGSLVNPNDVLGLLLDYVLRERGPIGNVARTVATTHLIDRVAAFHGVEVVETPVGFKYIGDLISKGEVVFGGEESAGLSIREHLPEKDGILACLLVAELLSHNSAPLKQQLENLWGRVGRSVHIRRDYRLTAGVDADVEAKLSAPPKELAGRPVRHTNSRDGMKLLLDDGWFLYRRSGTEALVRCYAEAPTAPEALALHQAALDYLFSSREVEMVCK